jgi:hypothetical protein
MSAAGDVKDRAPSLTVHADSKAHSKGAAPQAIDFDPVELNDVKVTFKGVSFRCHKAVLVRHCKLWRTTHELDPKAAEWPLPGAFSWTVDELKYFLNTLYTPIHTVVTPPTAMQWKSQLSLAHYFDFPALYPAAESALCKQWPEAFGNNPTEALKFATKHRADALHKVALEVRRPLPLPPLLLLTRSAPNCLCSFLESPISFRLFE